MTGAELLWPGISRCVSTAMTPGTCSAGETSSRFSRPCANGHGHDSRQQLARQRRDIIEKHRFPADVARGRIVRNIFSNHVVHCGTPSRALR